MSRRPPPGQAEMFPTTEPPPEPSRKKPADETPVDHEKETTDADR